MVGSHYPGCHWNRWEQILQRRKHDIYCNPAGFDYEFGAIEGGPDNKLAKAYKNLLFVSNISFPDGVRSYLIFSADAFLDRSDASIAFEAFWGKIPQWLVTVVQRVPTKRLQRLQNYMKTAREVAQTLIDRQMALHGADKNGARDIMSILSKYVPHNTRFKHVYSAARQLGLICPRIPRPGSEMRKSWDSSRKTLCSFPTLVDFHQNIISRWARDDRFDD